MKKLLAILLMCLTCVTAFAEGDASGAAESFGWGAGTVHYVSLGKAGYTLGGIGVRYTLSYILESGTERVSFVSVQAEKLPL